MNWSFFVAGLVAHLIFFYSIFDIYFTSPLLHGMTPQRSSIPAPAKRLVLFVADGLRADSFYKLDSTGQSRAPFLRNKIMNDGVWGVSHTRVPTESRPGHVALIAGFYEDVSAVAKGWKENPVEFDSVFNESRSTWSWGSPDILPMFAKGATGDHVHTFMYPAESEDFAGSDASKLDTWVFSSVEDFFERAKHDDALLEKLKQYQIVFFLHLLGIDVNGHSKKPKSQEYQENIAIVDAGIKETVQLIEDFYERDGRTSYVFTADHGMTNWGSHGASDPSETMTPFVAWGAGIRSPLPLDPSVKQEELQTEWSLETIQRSDVAQADIASLMSVLLGLPLPLQSVGTVPVQVLRSHNSEDHVFQAHALYAKARQMLQQMHVSGRHRQRTTLSWLFVLFRSLPMQLEVSMIEEIESALQAGLHERAMTVAQQLVDLAQDGLSYYHHYDRFFLGVSVTLGFAGWLGSVLELLLDKHTLLTVAGAQQHIERRRSLQPFWTSSKGIRVAFILFAAINCILLYVQSLPWTYYIYTLLPVLLWQNVIQNRQAIVDAFYYVFDHGMLLRFVKLGILAVLALEVIVISFFYRQILTVGFIAIAIWPVVEGQHLDWSAIGWVGSCLFLSVFPSLPPVGGETKYTLLCSSGLCLATLFAVGQVVAGVKPQNKENVRSFQIISIIQISICVLAVYLVWSTSASIKAGQGLPLLNQILSWGVLLVSPGLPLFTETSLYCRLQALMQAWTPIYILLSISHEGLFLGGLCALLLCWLHLENAVVYKKPVRLETLDFARGPGMLESRRKLWPSDVRMAYFYCFFLITAFFGTGNIASINSFDISSVYCFITVFSPFTMGALLLFKILIPFLLVACAFRGIHLAQNVPTQSLFLLVLLMSDFMALHFFLLVRDSGSWLEIGTSISHYVIVMALILFILLLLALSQVLTGFSLIHRTKKYKV